MFFPLFLLFVCLFVCLFLSWSFSARSLTQYTYSPTTTDAAKQKQGPDQRKESQQKAAKTKRAREQLCNACMRVVDVNIKRGSCVPANGAGFQVLQVGSLQDRCLFLADSIAKRSTELLSAFKSNVCSCLGCCGDGQCYFPNIEQQWLASLVDNVQQRVTKELELEGWKFEL